MLVGHRVSRPMMTRPSGGDWTIPRHTLVFDGPAFHRVDDAGSGLECLAPSSADCRRSPHCGTWTPGSADCGTHQDSGGPHPAVPGRPYWMVQAAELCQPLPAPGTPVEMSSDGAQVSWRGIPTL